jgi:hypothetical protein
LHKEKTQAAVLQTPSALLYATITQQLKLKVWIFAQALALLKRRAAQIFDALPLVKFNLL